MIRKGFRPTDPRLIALKGPRHAASYDFCRCGGPKARAAKLCQECHARRAE